MRQNNKKVIIILCVMLLLLVGTNKVFSEIGSSSDPLISKGYLDKKLLELKSYVDKEISKTENNSGGNKPEEGSNGNIFKSEVLELKKGQILIGYAGTEIILRGGKAKPYNVKMDAGLADITGGQDIDNKNKLLPYNHLLIVPRDDGRGAYVVDDAIFMVRGKYKIK